MYEKLTKHLRQVDVKSFRNFVRIDPDMFNQMVEDLTPRLQKKTTNCRKPLCTGLKLAITLRYPPYLATGLLQVTGLWVPGGPNTFPQYEKQRHGPMGTFNLPFFFFVCMAWLQKTCKTIKDSRPRLCQKFPPSVIARDCHRLRILASDVKMP